MKYKINIINFPIKVENNIFKNNLLKYIYELYDFKNRKIQLFTYDNYNNKNPKLMTYFDNLQKSLKESLKKSFRNSFKKSFRKSFRKSNKSVKNTLNKTRKKSII